MTLEELLNDLQALVDQYSDGTEPTEEDAARMAELTDQINERTAQTGSQRRRRERPRRHRRRPRTARGFRAAGAFRQRRWHPRHCI